MSTLQVLTYENVTIMPKYKQWCWPIVAYANNEVIPTSHSGVFLVNPPEIEAQVLLDQEVIFGGTFVDAFGHFFIETLDRLWFAKENPHLPILFPCEFTVKTWMQEIFDILGIKNQFISATVPTKVTKVHFPCPLIIYGNFLDERYLNFLNVYEAKPIQGKKVFISRGKNISGYSNNHEIETYAFKEGYSILEPESISMKKRLYEFATAEEILAVEGSSLYSLALVKNLTAKVFIIPRPMDMYLARCIPNRYYLNIDSYVPHGSALCSTASLYLNINSLDKALKEQKYLDIKLPENPSNISLHLQKIAVKHVFFDNLVQAAFSTKRKNEVSFFSKMVDDFYTQCTEKGMDKIKINLILFFYILFPFIGRSEYIASIEKFLSLYNILPQSSHPMVYSHFFALLKISSKIMPTKKIISFTQGFIQHLKNSINEELILNAQFLLLELYNKEKNINSFDILLQEICQKKDTLQNLSPYQFLPQFCTILRKQGKRALLLKFLEEHQQKRMPWISLWYKEIAIEYNLQNNEDKTLLYAYKAHSYAQTDDTYKNFLIDSLIQYNKIEEAENLLLLFSWSGDNSLNYQNIQKNIEIAKHHSSINYSKKEKRYCRKNLLHPDLILFKSSFFLNIYIKFTYLRYRILTEISFGKTKNRYKQKKYQLRNLLENLQ